MKSKARKSRPATAKRKAPALGRRSVPADWHLRLYVAGQTPKSLTAFANLKKICEKHLAHRYSIEVIDLSREPELAANDQVVALPTLVRKLPPPIKRIIGDLSNTENVLLRMDLKPLN